jgi:protein-tyrosine phosphatase
VNGGFTRPRVFIRSDHLGLLNASGRQAFEAYGVTTVLDLRSDGEVARAPSPFAGGVGATYVRRVLIDDKNMNNIGDSRDMLERYLFILENRPESFGEVFTTLAHAQGTVIFHCFAGKDRTGLVSAMLLALAGASPDDIAADYGETDVQLAKQYEIWINEAEPAKREAFRKELHCPPERILGVLEHLDRKWGGVAGYLEAAGVSPVAIDRVAAKLV